MQPLAVRLAHPLFFRYARPGSHPAIAMNLTLVVLGCVLLTALAQIRFPMPGSPIPVTLQSLAVLLIGASLGKRRAIASVVLYLVASHAGRPVFTGDLAGPSAGYLYGSLASAYVVGAMAERGLDRSWKTALPAFIVGEVVIFAFGLIWLKDFVGAERVFALGLYPFIPGELLKVAIATTVLPMAWKFVRDSGEVS